MADIKICTYYGVLQLTMTVALTVPLEFTVNRYTHKLIFMCTVIIIAEVNIGRLAVDMGNASYVASV